MAKRKCILLTNKPWHDQLFGSLQKNDEVEWTRIKTKEDFNLAFLKNYNPDKVFIPHWSEIIPEEIYAAFECVVFHMTDLPYGRGGSPLQNLIVRKKTSTKLTAIRVEKGIDTGPIYLKRDLSLTGTALEIFERSAGLMDEMIAKILFEEVEAKPQEGSPEVFKRRKAEEGDLSNLTDLSEVHDYIRMLDCPGYPPAFIEVGNMRLEFSKADLNNAEIHSQVKITFKNKE